MAWLDNISLQMIIIACLFLGLAPFFPEPHLWEKLKMLSAGTLVKPLDIFDLVMHGSPFVVLILKLLRMRGLF
ncbi:MAG: RND transporter [Sedimenticola sp.]